MNTLSVMCTGRRCSQMNEAFDRLHGQLMKLASRVNEGQGFLQQRMNHKST